MDDVKVFENEYNSEGLKTKSMNYDAAGKLKFYTEYEYNSDGNEIKSVSYTPNGQMEPEQSRLAKEKERKREGDECRWKILKISVCHGRAGRL
ncbi:MAG: hypothetical protein MR391_06740 [Dorea formicigenerans]|nr:hypothetical protein [Dorea formicigenerans]